MLVEFSVKNHLSFKERATLSMVASTDRTLPENTFEAPGPGRRRLLKSACLYGANASGKSNVLKALQFLERFVLKSVAMSRSKRPIGVSPFRLDAAMERRPSEFEVSFISGEERYVYGIIADQERVHEEWLTATRTKPRLLFHRKGDDVDFGSSWRGPGKALMAAMRPSALFLTVAAELNSSAVTNAFEWFQKIPHMIGPLPEMGAEIEFTKHISQHAEPKSRILDMIRRADLGIADFDVQEIDTDEIAEELAGRPDEAREAVLLPMPTEMRRITVSRDRSDSTKAHFDFAEESEGTQRLFALSAPWIVSMSMGHCLLIDELERKLHPTLTRHLIGEAHGTDSHAQLIFTTHDCALLDSGLFRRDQIWFTERRQDGSTDLYSLWQFRPRKGENIRNGYLQGRYGAIPFLGGLSVGEEDKERTNEDEAGVPH